MQKEFSNSSSPDLRHLEFVGIKSFLRREPVNRGIDTRTPLSSGLRETFAAHGIIDAIFAHAGLQPLHYRPGPLLRRVPSCLRSLSSKSPAEALEALQQIPELHRSAINSLLLGVTKFFRDAVVFQTIDVALSRCSSKPSIRVWSAGCSSGAELYSLAILLSERQLLSRSYLLGTDVRPMAIQAAREGRYSEGEVMTELPRSLGNKYFNPDGHDSVQVKDSLKQATSWKVQDVLASVEHGPWDIVFCRNLMMYLENAVATHLSQQLFEVLAPGGLLVLGRAEKPPRSLAFEKVASCVYAKRMAG